MHHHNLNLNNNNELSRKSINIFMDSLIFLYDDYKYPENFRNIEPLFYNLIDAS
jgi:hypothetical protein